MIEIKNIPEKSEVRHLPTKGEVLEEFPDLEGSVPFQYPDDRFPVYVKDGIKKGKDLWVLVRKYGEYFSPIGFYDTDDIRSGLAISLVPITKHEVLDYIVHTSKGIEVPDRARGAVAREIYERYPEYGDSGQIIFKWF